MFPERPNKNIPPPGLWGPDRAVIILTDRQNGGTKICCYERSNNTGPAERQGEQQVAVITNSDYVMNDLLRSMDLGEIFSTLIKI